VRRLNVLFLVERLDEDIPIHNFLGPMARSHVSPLDIPPAALAFLPPDSTSALALSAGAFVPPPKTEQHPPALGDVWSPEKPTLQLRDLLQIPLYAPELYRDLEQHAACAWKEGARLLQGLHPDTFLPFWFITYAVKMCRISEAHQNWSAAHTFLKELSKQDLSPKFAHVVPAADRLMERLPYDAKVGKGVLGGDLAVLFSREYISGAMVNVVVEALTQRIADLGDKYSHIHICSSDVMDLFGKDEGWDTHEPTKQMSRVSTLSCS
jgi:hypothetical protein